MANLPPYKPLFPPRAPQPKAPPKYTPGVTDFPKAAVPKRPSVSPTETILGKSPIPLLRPPKPAPVPKKAPPVAAPPKRSPRQPAKPAQLPSTSGKTTVPSRAVTPHPAPPASSVPVVAPKTPKAPGRQSAPKQPAQKRVAADAASATAPAPLTPDQYAAQAVQQALAPLYAAQTGQATSQNAAITNLTQAVIAALGGAPAQIGSEYDNAIGQQTNLSNAAADALRGANPNTQDQALLSAINAPQAQHDQLAGQNNAAFNGAAAVGQYIGGVLPMSGLESQNLAAMGLAHQQPAIEGLRGQQALSAALAKQSDERAKIDAMRPDLIQKYTAAQTAAEQKQQYLNMVERKFGYQVKKDNRDYALAVVKTNVGIDRFNAGQTTKASKIDVQVSKGFGDGLAHNSSGAVITSGGKPLQFNPNTSSVTTKPPSGKDINRLIEGWKSGKTVSKSVQAPNPDQNGNPVVRTVKTTTGQLNFQQAYRRLRAMGVADKTARQYLQTAYKRGEQGRGWLTNEQQAVLRKAGRQSYVGKYQGHQFISLAQYVALKKANNVPPGELVNGRYFIAPGY